MKHFAFAALVILGLAALGFFALGQVQYLPPQASLQAQTIDSLFRLEFGIIVILFALIVGLMLYSILVFRRKKGDTSDGPHIEGNTRLEVFWTIAPLAIVLYLAYLGSVGLGDITRAAARPLEVNVIGSQWSWRFEYPDYGVISTELVLPVDRQALLHLSSTDVIHSFWVPEFRLKQDALPGGDKFVRDLRVTPNQLGEYKVRCAELCGLNHALMESPVKVVPADMFEAWIKIQNAALSDDPAVRGQQWATQFACASCHSFDGAPKVGPTWKGIFGSQELLTDGTRVPVEYSYLYKSIRDPGAQIVKGYENVVMPPTIAAGMSEEQVNDVIALIESLK